MGCSALVQPRHRAYQEVNDRVLTEMATALTGNTDVTFMPGMTSRHQGVIDTARVVRQRGRGPKCPRRSRTEPPRRLNREPGVEADAAMVDCG